MVGGRLINPLAVRRRSRPLPKKDPKPIIGAGLGAFGKRSSVQARLSGQHGERYRDVAATADQAAHDRPSAAV